MTTLIPQYDQGSTGAVNRPINQKLAESVSVLDFGADPTGVSDSSSAFTNAVASGHSIYIPEGNYSVNVQLSLSQGQRVYGEGRNLTSITVPDAFTGSLFILQQGCEIYDMTLTRVTTGVYNSNGVAIQVDYVSGNAWNTVVKNVVFNSWNYADNITNYRHIREGNMYYYCNYGTVVGYDTAQSAGTVLIQGCAYLYSGQIGLWSRSTTTHTQVKATTFEGPANQHIVCDGVLYIDSCYIADFGAYCITGIGRIFFENGLVTPFQAGANNNGADFGYNFVTTDNEYALSVANGVVKNVVMGINFDFIAGQARRGAVLGPGQYVLENSYFQNNVLGTGDPSPFHALYPLEYSSTINQQIMENSTNLPNYATNGTFLNRSASLTGFTSAGIRNPWGGDIKIIPAATSNCTINFSLSAEYTIGDPLLLMVYVGTVSGGYIEVNFNTSTNIVADDTDYQQLIQYSSKLSSGIYELNSGNSYGSTNNFALNSFIVKPSSTTGTIVFSSSGGGTGQIAAVILTPIANDPNLGRPIGWFKN